MSDSLMTIRQMCDLYEVTPRTLRFYEAKELLFPIREGQKRWFTKRDRARLTLILRGKRYGISLESIRQLLDLYDRDDTRGTQLAAAIDVAGARLAEMRAARDELNGLIAELEQELDGAERDLTAIRTDTAA